MFKHMLIPTDGSQNSEVALAFALALARICDSFLEGLYVVDIKIIQSPLFTDLAGSMGVLPPSYEFVPLIERGLTERGDVILADFKRQCERAGVRHGVKKVTGIVDEIIIDEGARADCIVLAQHGEHGALARGGLLGSTSEAVVRKSRKPVLMTPAHVRAIETIGLAFDGSDPAWKALHVAAELSECMRCPLRVLVVTDDEKRADMLREAIPAVLGSYAIDSAIEVREGKEETQIVAFAGEGSIDLLVMGAYGHSRIRELILGSTTSYVIRNSTIPVLMTR